MTKVSLERKTTVFNSNVQAVSSHTRKITTESREFSSKLDDFVKVSKQHVANIRTEADQYRTKELETLAGFSAKINQQVEKVQEILKAIRAKEEASDEVVGNLQSAVSETQEAVQVAFDAWAESVKEHCEVMCKEVETSATASYASVRIVPLSSRSTTLYTGVLRSRRLSNH